MIRISLAIPFIILSRFSTICFPIKGPGTDLVIKADELVNLVADENLKAVKHRIWSRKFSKRQTAIVRFASAPTLGPQEDLPKRHKIWSRWGKWGSCSVSCGDGIITRRRICVAGRCAPGEVEEQHRPCSKTPCCATTVDMLDGE